MPKLPAEATTTNSGTLLVKQTESKPTSLTLLKLEAPGIHTKAYALLCKLRCKNVEGQGYLEMWNEFPPDDTAKNPGRYFTRTMGDTGPRGRISGTADWRAVVLPFNAEGTKRPPQKIELNLVLSGRGEIEIKDMELAEFADAGAMFGSVQMAAGVDTPGKVWIRGPYSLTTMVIVVVVAFAIARNMRKRRDLEQRRMRAMDAV